MTQPDLNASALHCDRNSRTISAYEGYARNYALLIGPEPSKQGAEAMRRLRAALGDEAHVLEVGSGTGHDADFLERLGTRVRRTDAARAFVEIQAERGRHAEMLDVVRDDLGGPYDGIVALCVLIHVQPAVLPDVLTKLHAALRLDGALLVSMREGVGAEEPGPWFTALWERRELEAVYSTTGFVIEWSDRHVDGDGERWMTHLLRSAR